MTHEDALLIIEKLEIISVQLIIIGMFVGAVLGLTWSRK